MGATDHLRRAMVLASFLALATIAVLAIDRVVQPPMTRDLLMALATATVAGLPGFARRRLAPMSIPMMLAGAYLLARVVLPLPDNVEGLSNQYGFYVDQLAKGVATYARDIFPLTLEGAGGLRLLLALAAYEVFWLAALFGLGLRRTLAGISLMLVTVAVCLTVDSSVSTVLVAIGFLVCSILFLLASRALKTRRWSWREPLTSLFAGAVASLVGLAVLGVVPSFAAQGWQDWRTWDPFGQGGTVVYSWMQNYPKLLDPSNKFTVMRVVSERPYYWRANTLDIFTRSSWVSGEPFSEDLPARERNGVYVFDVPTSSPEPPSDTVVETFSVEGASTRFLFVGGIAKRLTTPDTDVMSVSPAGAMGLDEPLGPRFSYQVVALVPTVHPADLVGAGTDYPADVRRYLALPFPTKVEVDTPGRGVEWWQTTMGSNELDAEFLPLYDLNSQIVGDAADPYDVVLRIEQYLRTRFDYSLRPPASESKSPYAAFLFDTHTGYCQHFAGSMALLLRYNGIPARVALGFASGDRQGDTFIVSTNNAHAWVEAYFPGFGWLPFDPTPGRQLPGVGPSLTTDGFTNPFSHDSPAPSTPGTIPVDSGQGRIDEGTAQAASGRPGGGGTATIPVWAAIGVAIILAIVAWPFGRRVYGKLRLRSMTQEDRLISALPLLRRDLEVWGLAIPPGFTFRDLTPLLRRYAGIDPSRLAERFDAVAYGGQAARPDDLRQADALRKVMWQGMRRNRGWVRTLAAWYGVTSKRSSWVPGGGLASMEDLSGDRAVRLWEVRA